MATVNDIPERGGVSGEDQLKLLRAYLKDSDPLNYTYPDALLIPLLVTNDPVTVWRNFIGASPDSVPWSYTPSVIDSPIDRIRVLTGDTVELSLKYTDYELEKYLKVIPLRYVVSLIKAKAAEDTTYPTDPYNPIRIVREYLDDKSGNTYTDAQIVELLFSSGLDPFAFVVEVMKTQSGKSAASSSISESGDSLFATLDGISFSSKSSSDQLSSSDQNQSRILEYGASTIYGRSSEYYGFWIDGENLVDVDWESEWYAI